MLGARRGCVRSCRQPQQGRGRQIVLYFSQPAAVQAGGREARAMVQGECSPVRTGHGWEVGKAPLGGSRLPGVPW